MARVAFVTQICISQVHVCQIKPSVFDSTVHINRIGVLLDP